MNSREPEPLWREVVGDREPWRRGRLFLILLGVLSFCFQGLSLGHDIVTGNIEQALSLGVFALLFWLQFYFIWIGVHWVRWLSGAWSALWGFTLVIWGFRDGVTFAIALGLYSFGVGVYLGLAPSVYFFARRQRESVRLLESLVVAAVFVLLLGSMGAGVLGLLGYKAHLEREARRFADDAFAKIFTDHDTYFLLEHVANRVLEEKGGRDRLTRFNQGATIRAGDVHDIKPARGSLRLRYSFPLSLGGEGAMIAEGVGDHGRRIRLHLVIGEEGGAWKIHGVEWNYL